MTRELVDGLLAGRAEALYEAEMRGRRRYHDLRDEDLPDAIRRAIEDASGLVLVRNRYQQAATPADVRAFARGLLDERDASKRACGLSVILCTHEHGVACSGAYRSLRRPPAGLPALHLPAGAGPAAVRDAPVEGVGEEVLDPLERARRALSRP